MEAKVEPRSITFHFNTTHISFLLIEISNYLISNEDQSYK